MAVQRKEERSYVRKGLEDTRAHSAEERCSAWDELGNQTS